MKTKKTTFIRSVRMIGLILVVVIGLDSCKKTTVPPISTTPGTSFNNIWVNGSCTVTFTTGTVNAINSKDPSVMTFTMGNTLMLNGSGNISISIKDLDTLFSNGNSDIDGSAVTLKEDIVVACNGSDSVSIGVNSTDSITVLLNGAGNYIFNGTTPKLNLGGNGSGRFWGYNLISQNADVAINGSADQQVYVSGVLNVWMNGSGDLYYKGNPTTVNKFNSGTGTLIPQ
ncbi:MAG: GIN domain-containing protein [Bacteroidota bacterium]